MAPWPWQMENTVVDSARHSGGQPHPALHHSFPASTSSSRPSPWDCCTLRSIGSWLYQFSFFCLCFVFFFFSFKATSDLKGQFSLLSVGLSSMARSRKGYPLQCVFHHLNPISGSRRSLSCQAQFAASPEAWGRGPSRRRVILRTQPSRRNECLVLSLCVPSVPLSERQRALQ